MRRHTWILLLLAPLLLAACSPLVVVNGITPDAARVEADQAYGALERQQLDVYYPAEGNPEAPVLVFFYGGSWQNGDRGDYAFVGDSLAADVAGACSSGITSVWIQHQQPLDAELGINPHHTLLHPNEIPALINDLHQD